MFSPSKSYSQLLQKQPQNLVSFKQQTLSLLKQQSQKIRQLKAYVSSKDQELMIKDEQIKFLKETVRELEDEGEVLIGEKNQMKLKLEKIVEEVKSYNLNVVKPICDQKEQLKKVNNSLKQINLQLEKSLSDTSNQLAESESKLKAQAKQQQKTKSLLKQQQITCFQHQKKLEKECRSLAIQMEEILKLSNEVKLESSRRSRLQIEVEAVNKQLSSVINKHNSAMKEYEVKISELTSSKIDVSEVAVYQELVKSKEQEIGQLSSQLSSLNKQYQQAKSRNLFQRENNLREIVELKIVNRELVTDLTNLQKSTEVGRKIVQFQSEHSGLFYVLYQRHEALTDQNNDLKEQQQQLLTQNQRLSRDVERLSERLKDSQLQETLIKTQLHEELQRIESTYQGKLVSLNLKIRKEQDALDKLKKRQIQAMEQQEHLLNQLQTQQQDFSCYKLTTEHSLEKLHAQNYRLVNQMQELYQICSDNVDNKRIVDKIKHLIHALLTGVYFLHNQIMVNKQKQRHIYLPLINSYLTLTNKIALIQSNITQSQLKNYQLFEEKPSIFEPTKKTKIQPKSKPKDFPQSQHIKKLRISVCTVIACIRMQKGLQKIGDNEKGNNLSSLNLKLFKAINTRTKTFSISELMQKEEEAYTKHEQPQAILAVLLQNTEKAFSWPQLNFKNLKLAAKQHLNTLAKIQLLTSQSTFSSK